tara:strand:+ start:940 stop:1590 length:651 start_codon:yes stop_codon:yes gene_type:complete
MPYTRWEDIPRTQLQRFLAIKYPQVFKAQRPQEGDTRTGNKKLSPKKIVPMYALLDILVRTSATLEEFNTFRYRSRKKSTEKKYAIPRLQFMRLADALDREPEDDPNKYNVYDTSIAKKRKLYKAYQIGVEADVVQTLREIIDDSDWNEEEADTIRRSDFDTQTTTYLSRINESISKYAINKLIKKTMTAPPRFDDDTYDLIRELYLREMVSVYGT